MSEPANRLSTCTNRDCKWEQQKVQDLTNECHEHKKSADFFQNQAKAWEGKYETAKAERNGYRSSVDHLMEEKEALIAERDASVKKLQTLEGQLAAIQKNLQIEEDASPFNTILTMFRDPCLAS